MKWMEELRNLEIQEDPVDIIKREALPVVLWGAGEFAGEIWRYLKNRDVEISQVVVDDDYFTPGSHLGEYKVIPRSELMKQQTMVNVVWANSSYEKIPSLACDCVIHKVYYIFSVNYGIHKQTPISYIEEHLEELDSSYAVLEDEISRKNFLAFIKTRVTGDNAFIWQEFMKEGNFFHNDVFCVDDREVLFDVGAYDGDTIRLFLKETGGKYRYIYAWEPDAQNFLKLENYIRGEDLKNIETMAIGAWNSEGTIAFSAVNEQISSVSVGSSQETAGCTSIPVKRIDEMAACGAPITMLKINYHEGVYEALEGAAGILKGQRPKLAITVGFNCANICRIPQLIKEINPQYRLYLRFNRAMVSACTLYGICGAYGTVSK